MWKDIFVKRKYATLQLNNNVIKKEKEEMAAQEKKSDDIDVDVFTRCPSCKDILINIDLQGNLDICPKCNHHFRVHSKKRIDMTFDEGSIECFDENLGTMNPLSYPEYTHKIVSTSKLLGINEAVVTGKGCINGNQVCFGVMDSRFIMGSMGSVVGEKLSRMFERATDDRLPAIVFCVSGGARMQEGMLSLSQMTKVSASLKRHSNKGLLYISVLTDPTTGGVMASFAMLGDIIIAEPKATLGFAGKRVIEQTIRQTLPDTFQKSEFMLEHGFVDMIVDRKDMKDTLSKLLSLHREVN